MNIQWFPGHMAKTRRLISENISNVDIVVELLDARIPQSSRNPEIDRLVRNKKRIICMNKRDLADPENVSAWKAYYAKALPQAKIVSTNSSDGNGVNEVKKAALEMMQEKLERAHNKGIVNRSIKLMVVGIPNVGKSSFINRLTHRSITETGDRPGVTKSKQWVRIDKDIELLDTPGVLWPKFDDPEVGLNLAFTGAIKDEILDIETLASNLLDRLSASYFDLLCKRYSLELTSIAMVDEMIDEQDQLLAIDPDALQVSARGFKLLELIGAKRGCLIKGGLVDTNRASNIVIDEFRSGLIGKISLEYPMG